MAFLNMDLQIEMLVNFEFWGYQIYQQIVHNIIQFHSHVQLKFKISKQSSKNKKI